MIPPLFDRVIHWGQFSNMVKASGKFNPNAPYHPEILGEHRFLSIFAP